MTSYVALLRGVNLGKRQLKMEDLRRIAAELGLEAPRTYIASGNLMFRSARSEKALKADLEKALADHMGAKVGVMLRTADELAAAADANPFGQESASFTVAIFLDAAPPKGAFGAAKIGSSV